MRCGAAWLAFLLVTANPLRAAAATLGTDFSTSSGVDPASTAVWNLATQTVHVPFVVDRTCDHYNACGSPGTESVTVDIGNGSDGVFDATTYTRFDTNHGTIANHITLDTSREYQFVSFTLDSGYTLTGTGGNPISIHVQGDAVVDGVIDVSGGNGGNPIAPGGSAPAGGTATCGGLPGGAGGTGSGSTLNGLQGGSIGSGSAGGGGQSQAAAGGGGGAGASGFSFAASPGGGGLVGGPGGSQLGGAFDSYLDLPSSGSFEFGGFGGSGGGGGGAWVGTSYGAGGGGGGGVILFQVGGNLTISATGQLRAVAGNGGTGTGLGGGCGGGGAGGGIRIYTGGNVTDLGALHAEGGTGGSGCGGFAGTNGAPGLLSWSTFYGDILPGGSLNEHPSPQTPFLGETFYSLHPYTLLSTVIDTGITNPTYTGVTISDNANGGTLTYQFAGSNDAFAADNTGWLPRSQIAALTGKRYFKYQIQLQAATRTASPTVQSLSVGVQTPQFDYRLAGCARIATPAPDARGGTAALALVIYLFCLPRWLRNRIPRREKARR